MSSSSKVAVYHFAHAQWSVRALGDDSKSSFLFSGTGRTVLCAVSRTLLIQTSNCDEIPQLHANMRRTSYQTYDYMGSGLLPFHEVSALSGTSRLARGGSDSAHAWHAKTTSHHMTTRYLLNYDHDKYSYWSKPSIGGPPAVAMRIVSACDTLCSFRSAADHPRLTCIYYCLRNDTPHAGTFKFDALF